MLHVDEHTLELYALGAPEAQPRRAEITSHLSECAGCRDLVAEMTRFHAELADQMERAVPAKTPPGRALATRDREGLLRPAAEPYAPPVRYAPRTPMQKFRYLMIRYPAAAAVAGVTMAASFLALGMLISGSFRSPAPPEAITDRNPALLNYNAASEMLEVLNIGHQLLWEKKSPSLLATQQTERTRNTKRSIITDLDGDGTNEVVTTIGLLGHDSLFAAGDAVKVFDGDGKLRWSRQFSEAVPYPGRSYSSLFVPRGIFAWTDPATGGKNLLVIADHISRSPALVYRLDAAGQIVGKFWHFGIVDAAIFRAIGPETRPKFVISGKNDVIDDSTHGEFAFVAVLDPSRILGERRSVKSPVYSLPASDAESFYVRFPKTDFDSVANVTAAVRHLDGSDPSMLMVVCGPDDGWTLDYAFDNALALAGVKSQDWTDARHKELERQGKLTRTINESYLSSLRDGVRYWDGSTWQKDRAPIRPPRP